MTHYRDFVTAALVMVALAAPTLLFERVDAASDAGLRVEVASGAEPRQLEASTAWLPMALHGAKGSRPHAPTVVPTTPAPGSPTATDTSATPSTPSPTPSASATLPSGPGIPNCRETTGDRGGLRFSLDGGASLAPNAARLAPLAYTWDLIDDPRDPDVLLELHQDTLFRSEDAGCTLQPLATLDRPWDNLVRAPSDPDTLYATTIFASEIGISHDGGASWGLQPLPEDTHHLAVDPADESHLVFAGREHLYEQAAAGERWTALPDPAEDMGQLTTAASAPSNWRRWLVGSSTVGLYRTDDLGQTWLSANEGLWGEVGSPPEPVLTIVPLWVSYSPSDADVVYLNVNRVGRSASERGLWRSDDGGATWARRVVEGQVVDGTVVDLTAATRIFVSPHDADHVLFAFGATTSGYGTDLYRSRDGLQTLQLSHFDDFYEVFAVVFGPAGTDVLFLGTSSDIPTVVETTGTPSPTSGTSEGTQTPDTTLTPGVTPTSNGVATPDLARLPLGDGRISSEPEIGAVWSCNTDLDGNGAFRDGPWIGENTFDLLQKAIVDGANRQTDRPVHGPTPSTRSTLIRVT